MKSDTQMLEPFREWTTPDGEYWGALHPLFMAVAEYYLLGDDRMDRRFKRTVRLVNEIASGERRPLPGMLDCMLEIDRVQQENGCLDENLGSLAALLRGESRDVS